MDTTIFRHASLSSFAGASIAHSFALPGEKYPYPYARIFKFGNYKAYQGNPANLKCGDYKMHWPGRLDN